MDSDNTSDFEKTPSFEPPIIKLGRTQPTPRTELPRPSIKDSETTRALLDHGAEKFVVENIIAKGGMGTVSVARDGNCRRRVAMKKMTPDDQICSEDILRFVEEAQITSQLEHPNIVPVHELGLDAERNVFYVMKLVQGITLTDILLEIRHGNQETIEKYPLERLLTIFLKVCDAMAFAHSKHVIHRDLKPDNVMIGDFGEVLIMDWGLAKVLPSEPTTDTNPNKLDVVETSSLNPDENLFDSAVFKIDAMDGYDIGSGLRTMSGRIMGTPGFMAPEQTYPKCDLLGVHSDIYALGAILYSIMTLRPPITDSNVMRIIELTRQGAIAPPSDYGIQADGSPPRAQTLSKGKPVAFAHCPGGSIPVELSRIAMKALSNNPANRHTTIKHLQEEIEDYQHGRIWHLVVDEDFSHLNSDTWTVAGGEHEITDGELRMHGGKPQLLLLNQGLSGDVRIEFECRQESVILNTIGCFISAAPLGNMLEIPKTGYEFMLGSYDNTLNVLRRSDRMMWREQKSSIVRGKKYHVMAERVGNRLRMLVNDEEIFTYIDPDPLSGKDRVAVGVHGWVADTRISNIKIYSMGTPWKTDILDMAERQLQKGHYLTAADLFQEVLDSFPDADRRALANKGLRTATSRNTMRKSIPEWMPRLQQAWDNAPVNMWMDNDGLTVDISYSGITDLSPLKGLPTTSLYCIGNEITDLSPLEGIPLKTLICSGNPITSLAPIKDMPLETLICECCRITDLEPLRKTPLTLLNCGGNPLENGIEALADTPQLNWLSCGGCNIQSLTPLHGLPLTALYCDANEIDDLSPLQGMTLNTLNCGGNHISDLSPLAGMPITALHCPCNQITTLEPLTDSPIKLLSCHANFITSLTPLKDMALSALLCGANQLTSLDPFISQPPDSFYFDCDTLTDNYLSWLHSRWQNTDKTTHLTQQIEVIQALRDNDLKKLKALASPFEGHLYMIYPKFLSWENAKRACEQLGGHLATISSHEENDFVDSLFPIGSWLWMGLLIKDRKSQWVTNEPYEYNAFIDRMHEIQDGPKVFFNGRWTSEICFRAKNCSIIEWE